jgi:hypothetical protein
VCAAGNWRSVAGIATAHRPALTPDVKLAEHRVRQQFKRGARCAVLHTDGQLTSERRARVGAVALTARDAQRVAGDASQNVTKGLFWCVPGAGVEPAWGFPRGILSPLRLPISPPGRARAAGFYRKEPL